MLASIRWQVPGEPEFTPDWDLWRQPANPYYLQYLDYQTSFLNATGLLALNVTEAPALEIYREPWDLPLKAVAALVLVMLSACFSGMTLGLMGLDPFALELIIKADPEGEDAIRAAKILPLRLDGNLLLCTLLLGNVSVNALTPILLDELLGQLASFFVSTFALVVLGEITPQAVISRYALLVGARLTWLVYVIRSLHSYDIILQY
jgi:hypothetical protein